MADTPAGGRKTKDREITDNFNPNKRGNLSPRQLRKVQKQAKANNDLPDISSLDDMINSNDDDTNSAFQMLKDMRAAYKSVDGRARLKTMIGNDKDFSSMVKELLKVESAILSAKMKEKGDGIGNGSAAVFVIIKGLEDEKRVKEAIKLTDTGVDLEQVMDALNPNAEKKIEVEEKMEGPETW
jgi:hypothetical protein